MARRVALFPTVPKKMIAFPFIYFVALSLYWWKKHQGLDLCVYMSALYAFTALMGIIAVAADMVGDGGILCDSGDVSISFIPTLVYCLCITACLLPFSMLKQSYEMMFLFKMDSSFAAGSIDCMLKFF